MIKLDLSGFELAQLKHLVEEANRKLDVVITATTLTGTSST